MLKIVHQKFEKKSLHKLDSTHTCNSVGFKISQKYSLGDENSSFYKIGRQISRLPKNRIPITLSNNRDSVFLKFNKKLFFFFCKNICICRRCIFRLSDRFFLSRNFFDLFGSYFYWCSDNCYLFNICGCFY